MTALMTFGGVSKSFITRRDLLGRARERLVAVDDVSFEIDAGKTLALVGESGAGKSTVGRLALMLDEPDAGTIRFEGAEVGTLRGDDRVRYRRSVQAVFQDPHASLNPRVTIEQSLLEPLVVHKVGADSERRSRVKDLLDRVELRPTVLSRHPHEMSGGQLQRVCIARSLTLQPKLIVCDEAVTALDVLVKANVIRLLQQIQSELGVAYLFVSHDLAVVRHLAHSVVVMRHGQIVEAAETASLFKAPSEVYTQALLAATPVPDPERQRRRREQRRAERLEAGLAQ